MHIYTHMIMHTSHIGMCICRHNVDIYNFVLRGPPSAGCGPLLRRSRGTVLAAAGAGAPAEGHQGLGGTTCLKRLV